MGEKMTSTTLDELIKDWNRRFNAEEEEALKFYRDCGFTSEEKGIEYWKSECKKLEVKANMLEERVYDLKSISQAFKGICDLLHKLLVRERAEKELWQSRALALGWEKDDE